MRKTALFIILSVAIAATFAFTHCGNCPGDNNPAPVQTGEVKAAKKNCADCPMHKKAAGNKDKHINCPEAKAEKKHDCSGCAGKMCPEHLPGAETSVRNTETGVEITVSAKDAKTVAKIQEAAVSHYSGKDNKCQGCPTIVSGAETKFVNIPAGITVNITGKNAETIGKIQAAAAREQAARKTETEQKAKPAAKVSKMYACPMKCATSDKPGKCPKCGMPMEEKK